MNAEHDWEIHNHSGPEAATVEYVCRRCRLSTAFGVDTSATIRDQGLAALPPCSRERDASASRYLEANASGSLMGRGARYLAALARWSAAGWPCRADEEIDRIYRSCCRPCDWRDAEKDVCRECGCPVGDAEAWPVRNKIAMATEHCAKGLW